MRRLKDENKNYDCVIDNAAETLQEHKDLGMHSPG